MPTDDKKALDELIEMMRLRASHWMLVKTSTMVQERLEARQRKRQLALTDELATIAMEIDDALNGHIPSHPAFNHQRLHTARTIVKNHLTLANPDRDQGVTKRALSEINDRAPTYHLSLGVKDVADLHRHLRKYEKLKTNDPSRFPEIHNLGSREDENMLLVDATRENSGTAKTVAQKGSLLKQINEELDKLVPRGTYFNPIRQRVISIVNEEPLIAKWVERDDANESVRKKNPEKFVSNTFHYLVQKPIEELAEELGDVHEHVKRITSNRRKLDLAAALNIAEDIQTYHHKQSGAETLATSVPIGVELVISRDVPFTSPDRDGAELGQSVTDMMDQILPPDKHAFKRREKFLRTVNSNRKLWLEGDHDDHGVDPVLPLRMSYQTAFKREYQIAKLAERLDAYQFARSGSVSAPGPSKRKALWLAEAHEPQSVEVPDTASAGSAAAKKPRAKRKFTELEKGQQLLSFSSNTKRARIDSAATESTKSCDSTTPATAAPKLSNARNSEMYLERPRDRQAGSVGR